MTRDTSRRLARGAFAGLVAGVVASFAMERFQSGVAAMTDVGGDSEPSTQRAAALATAATGKPLPAVDKPLGGQAVHYLLGTTLGVAYGISAEFAPSVTAGGGTLFGVGTALALDEAVVPAMGLSAAPIETPPAVHAYSLAAHLVFGGAAELVRRQMVSTFQPN